MTTRLEAKEEIHTLARRLIDDAWVEVLGTVPGDERKFRDGVEEAGIPNGGYYSITSVQTVAQPRRGIGLIQDSTAARYENIGNVFIKICGAKAEDDALYNIEQIAELLQASFNERRGSGAASSLYFVNARVNDRETQSGQWYQVYMVAEWRCDQIRAVATG